MEKQRRSSSISPLGSSVFRFRGSEDPTAELLVFIHDIGYYSKVWFPLVDELLKQNKNFRALEYDLLNFGRSRSEEEDFRIDTYVQQLDHLLRDTAADVKKVILVGHGIGALIACGFSAKQPHRVKKLILLAPTALLPERPKRYKYSNDFNQLDDIHHDWLKALEAKSLQLQPALKIVQKACLQYFPIEYRESQNIVSKLQGNRPTLLLFGKYDSQTPSETIMNWREAIPQAIIHSLPISHVVMAAWQGVSQTISEFLSESPSSAPTIISSSQGERTRNAKRISAVEEEEREKIFSPGAGATPMKTKNVRVAMQDRLSRQLGLTDDTNQHNNSDSDENNNNNNNNNEGSNRATIIERDDPLGILSPKDRKRDSSPLVLKKRMQQRAAAENRLSQELAKQGFEETMQGVVDPVAAKLKLIHDEKKARRLSLQQGLTEEDEIRENLGVAAPFVDRRWSLDSHKARALMQHRLAEQLAKEKKDKKEKKPHKERKVEEE